MFTGQPNPNSCVVTQPYHRSCPVPHKVVSVPRGILRVSNHLRLVQPKWKQEGGLRQGEGMGYWLPPILPPTQFWSSFLPIPPSPFHILLILHPCHHCIYFASSSNGPPALLVLIVAATPEMANAGSLFMTTELRFAVVNLPTWRPNTGQALAIS